MKGHINRALRVGVIMMKYYLNTGKIFWGYAGEGRPNEAELRRDPAR
jgi:hypothetical protein